MLKRKWFSQVPLGVVIGLTMALLVVLALSLAACAGPTSASTHDVTATPTQTGASILTVTATPAQTPAPTPISKPSGPVDAKLIDAQVNGDIVSIPVSEVQNDWNTRFSVQGTDGTISAMAYVLNGQIYVRADICPPCRSRSFTLNGNILDCDSCHTRFNASTGAGVSGACVSYPKDSVSYTINGGNVVMSKADIVTAYQNTLKPG
jgi:nitrite reductase/ring-hydroxylating ferredoxin subunit